MKQPTLLLDVKNLNRARDLLLRLWVLVLAMAAAFIIAGAFNEAVARSYPCYQNGKYMPAHSCALINMGQYVSVSYFKPSLQAFWVAPSAHGRFHSRWWVYVGPFLVRRQLTLSAKRCGNHYGVFDHRKRAWANGC